MKIPNLESFKKMTYSMALSQRLVLFLNEQSERAFELQEPELEGFFDGLQNEALDILKRWNEPNAPLLPAESVKDVKQEGGAEKPSSWKMPFYLLESFKALSLAYLNPQKALKEVEDNLSHLMGKVRVDATTKVPCFYFFADQLKNPDFFARLFNENAKRQELTPFDRLLMGLSLAKSLYAYGVCGVMLKKPDMVRRSIDLLGHLKNVPGVHLSEGLDLDQEYLKMAQTFELHGREEAQRLLKKQSIQYGNGVLFDEEHGVYTEHRIRHAPKALKSFLVEQLPMAWNTPSNRDVNPPERPSEQANLVSNAIKKRPVVLVRHSY